MEKGFSQIEMANRMHLSQSAYQRIEHGDSAWSEAQIVLAAEILDCVPREIMDDAPQLVQHNHDQSTGFQAQNQQLPEQSFFESIERMQQSYQESIRNLINELPIILKKLFEEKQSKS